LLPALSQRRRFFIPPRIQFVLHDALAVPSPPPLSLARTPKDTHWEVLTRCTGYFFQEDRPRIPPPRTMRTVPRISPRRRHGRDSSKLRRPPTVVTTLSFLFLLTLQCAALGLFLSLTLPNRTPLTSSYELGLLYLFGFLLFFLM